MLKKSLDEYIRYGGTLTPDGTKNAFHDAESTERYVNSAIAANIFHALKTWNDADNVGYDVLRDFIDYGLLESAVNKVLEYHNHQFTKKQIDNEFKPHDWGSVEQMMPGTIENMKLRDGDFSTENIKKLLQDSLNIKDHRGIRIDDAAVEFLINYLIGLDVLYPIPKVGGLDCGNDHKYLFTQVGMRYSQAVEQARVLSELFGNEELVKKLESDVCGQILEDIVFGQLLRECAKSTERFPRRRVTRYRAPRGEEIDILVLDRDTKTILAIEVKYSRKQVDNQRKYLLDEAVRNDIEQKTGMKIVARAVVYHGTHPQDVFLGMPLRGIPLRGKNELREDGVMYINADDFLLRSKETLQVLLAVDEGRGERSLERTLFGYEENEYER